VIIIKIESTVITHVGMVRGNNEDNYFINGRCKSSNIITAEGYADKKARDAYLYAVLDGMGGESFGEIASMIAAQTLKEYMSTDFRQTAADYVQRANNLICDEVMKNDGARSGTTLALLYIRDKKAIAYNLGDSRVYFLRKGNLVQLSEDHTEAQRLIKMGMLDEEGAKHHKSKNKLTQHFGLFPNEMRIEPFVSKEIKVKKNDIFLVCSDGLTDMVSDENIREIMERKDMDTSGIAKELSTAAKVNGGKDNITVIVVKVV
jgi:serine/threonine protein phosphatase PrpC